MYTMMMIISKRHFIYFHIPAIWNLYSSICSKTQNSKENKLEYNWWMIHSLSDWNVLSSTEKKTLYSFAALCVVCLYNHIRYKEHDNIDKQHALSTSRYMFIRHLEQINNNHFTTRALLRLRCVCDTQFEARKITDTLHFSAIYNRFNIKQKKHDWCVHFIMSIYRQLFQKHYEHVLNEYGLCGTVVGRGHIPKNKKKRTTKNYLRLGAFSLICITIIK